MSRRWQGMASMCRIALLSLLLLFSASIGSVDGIGSIGSIASDPLLQVHWLQDVNFNYGLECKDFKPGFTSNLISSFSEFLSENRPEILENRSLYLSYLSDMIMQRLFKQRSSVSLDVKKNDKNLRIVIPWNSSEYFPILSNIKTSCESVFEVDDLVCERYQLEALTELDKIVSSSVICHKGEVFERDFILDAHGESDIAYDIFFSRDGEKVYKRIREKYHMFHIIERESHILGYLREKGEDRVPKLLEVGSDFIIITHIGESINITSANGIDHVDNVLMNQLKQVTDIKDSMNKLGVEFSNDNDQRFANLNGNIKMDNFGWASIIGVPEDLGMIDGNRKDTIKKHEEQHLIVDWHRSLTESYCREFFHSRGLVFRFSLVMSTLPPDQRVSIISSFYNHPNVDDDRGTTPFTIYFVTDPKPKYEYRKTSHGISLVNVKMYDAKLTLRKMMSELFGHKHLSHLHATDDVLETQWNLRVLGLFGYYRYKYFTDLNEVFSTLNTEYVQNTFAYTLITDPDHMIYHLDEPGHDLDILVTDVHTSRNLLGGISFKGDNELVRVGSQLVMFDVIAVDGQYFSTPHSMYLLQHQMLHEPSTALVPPPLDFAYSKLFHHLLHGRTMTQRMLDLFVQHGIWNVLEAKENTYEALFKKLNEYLLDRDFNVFDGLKYNLQEVCNAIHPRINEKASTVNWDSETPWHLAAISMALADINVTNHFLSIAVREDFNKIDFTRGHEATVMLFMRFHLFGPETSKMLKIRLASKSYPETGFDYALVECIQLFYIQNNQLKRDHSQRPHSRYASPRFPTAYHLFSPGEGSRSCVTEFIEGVLLQIHMSDVITKFEVADFVLAMADLLLALQQDKVVHRDINPSNLIVHRDENVGLLRIALIDFSWAVSPVLKMMDSPPSYLNGRHIFGVRHDYVAHEDEHDVLLVTTDMLSLYSSANFEWLAPFLRDLVGVKFGDAANHMIRMATKLIDDNIDNNSAFIQTRQNEELRLEICTSYENDKLVVKGEKESLLVTSSDADMEEGYRLVQDHQGVLMVQSFGEKFAKLDRLVSSFINDCAKNMTVMEIGHHFGYFTVLSVLAGAGSVASYSTMGNFVDEATEMFAARFGSEKAEISVGSITDMYKNEKADIVVAVNLIEWLYYCSGHHHGGLSRTVGLIARKARKILIVEWNEPTNPSTPEFQYLIRLNSSLEAREEFNTFNNLMNLGVKTYAHRIFLASLIKIFGPNNVYEIGAGDSTSLIYVCNRERPEEEDNGIKAKNPTFNYSAIDEYDIKHFYIPHGHKNLLSKYYY